MAKVIMHVDLNYFFVRCEELKNPRLVNKPVMIGGVGRAGIVSTCSYKAREYGVKSGMPSYKAIELCPHIITIPGDYHYYSLMSREFIQYCKNYTHLIEQTSIDECYMDISSLINKENNIEQLLKCFQFGLLKKTGLKCSIGIGPTKFLAKMASDYKKPMGITIIRKRDIENILYPLDVSDFYGIGKRSIPRLHSIGIKTIGDLANFIFNDAKTAKDYFGSFYDYIKDALLGNTDDKIILESSAPKSIGNSMTLIRDTDDEEEIRQAITLLSKEVSQRANKEKLKGRTIQLTLKDSSFAVHSKSKTILDATNDYQKISDIAYRLYINNYQDNLYRLVGITLQNLSPLKEENEQLSFFDETPVDKVNDVINNVNRKFNKKVIDKASNLLKEKRYGNH